MAFDPFSAIFNLINTGLEKWIPDANERQKAASELGQQVHSQVMGQIEINKIEAANASIFVAGWRPFVGWVCGGAYAYTFVVQPFLIFWATVFQIHLDIAQLPVLDWSELGFVLFGMLGLGMMRSYDKKMGASNG